MAKLTLTPRAENDLYEIWGTIAADNIRAADGVFNKIMSKARLAAENPYMGVARPELSATARILVTGLYVTIYEPQPEGVLVVAIVHGMRDPESWLN